MKSIIPGRNCVAFAKRKPYFNRVKNLATETLPLSAEELGIALGIEFAVQFSFLLRSSLAAPKTPPLQKPLIERKIEPCDVHKEWDQEGGMNLDYFGMRYYDPETGIWISTDPKGQFYNAYAYAGNGTNPVIFVDPNGEYILGAIIGGLVMGYAQGAISSGSLNPGNWGDKDWLSAGMGAVSGAFMGSAIENQLWHSYWSKGGQFGLYSDYGRGVRGQLLRAGYYVSNQTGTIEQLAQRGGGRYAEPPAEQVRTTNQEAIMRAGPAENAPSRVLENQTTELSEIRLTPAEEIAIRYEAPQFQSRVTPTGGTTPGTYVAPSSDGIVPVGLRNPTYNLHQPDVLRTQVNIIKIPAGTPVIGPRPVAGGIGHEYLLPFGSP